MRKVVIAALLLACASCATADPPQSGPTNMFTVYSRMVNRDVTFKIDLDVPEGAGPFPAVVLMHGCGGMANDRSAKLWREVFRKSGYVTLILESFTPRGWPENICLKEPEIGWRGQNDRLAEAFGAARFLRRLPFVQKDTVTLMGFSHGGGTVLWAAHRDDAYWSSVGYGYQIERFNALIAVYPWCGVETHAFRKQAKPIETPLLILTGEHDTVTPPELCRKLAEFRGPISNGNLRFVVIPGAYHSFDSGIPVMSVYLCGGVDPKCGVPTQIGHSDAAFQRAQKDVAAFLSEKLPR